MTNKEAIKDIQDNILPVVGGKSLQMAIEALKAQIDKSDDLEAESAQNVQNGDLISKKLAIEKDINVPNTDCISRQAAIDLIEGIETEWLKGTVELIYAPAIKGLRALPSAQPQYEELTPEEAASEIASGDVIAASYWLDLMIRLKQMGYTICKKKNQGI